MESYEALLNQLIATWENEVVEFKQAGADYSMSDIGKYFSALANEANLRSVERAWLIFGVDNKTRQIVGTDYRDQSHNPKFRIAENTEPKITFREIHELLTKQGRALLFEIPAAPRGIPIAWKGHYYARAGESLVPLGLDKLDEIRQQTLLSDWSAQVVVNASLDDLDMAALNKARELFVLKHANRFSASEVSNWSVATLLDRAKLTQAGKITRAALLLLGKAESAYLLSPHPAQITWKLEGTRSYEHFSPPFLLATTQIYHKIRNVQLRLLPDNELLPYEVAQYDQKVVLEALHNCIAHQDYQRNGRVNVIEHPHKLVFENEGAFFEGQPEDYLLNNKMPRRYRNSFLAEAMVMLNMIDQMGFGIYDMHKLQVQRYLPLPDYDLSEDNMVRMTIHGDVVDPAYSQLLIQNASLSFADVLALDRVQKKLPISDEAVKRLRRAKLIEGRKPHFYVAASIAAAAGCRADYIRSRAQDDAFYAKLVIDYLSKFGSASREELDKLLVSKLSDVLDEQQKISKISNLLTNMRRAGQIKNTGARKKPCWKIAE